MANRYGNQFWYSLVPNKWSLFGLAAIGATGAPTINASKSKGFTSITRNSAGNYTLVLQDVWVDFLGFQATVLDSGANTVCTVYVVSQAVATSGTRTIVFQCLDFAGLAVDPRNGASIYWEAILKNSNAV